MTIPADEPTRTSPETALSARLTRPEPENEQRDVPVSHGSSGGRSACPEEAGATTLPETAPSRGLDAPESRSDGPTGPQGERSGERASGARVAPPALDRSRRHLVPVARLDLPDEPDVVHLSVYEWLPRFEEWATGLALCGASTEQGALPDGTAVTCTSCLEYKPGYERALTPKPAAGTPAPDTEAEPLELTRDQVRLLRDTCDQLLDGDTPVPSGLRRQYAAAIRKALRDYGEGDYDPGTGDDYSDETAVVMAVRDAALEQAEALAEQHARNTISAAREGAGYRKAWKAEQDRRIAAERDLKRFEAELSRLYAAESADAAAGSYAARAETAEALLRDLVDPDPCWYDHHGGCQAHGYLSLDPGERCPHAEAKELLAALDGPTALAASEARGNETGPGVGTDTAQPTTPTEESTDA